VYSLNTIYAEEAGACSWLSLDAAVGVQQRRVFYASGLGGFLISAPIKGSFLTIGN